MKAALVHDYLVDGGGADRTVAIAREAGARVLVNAWPGFSAQWNLAIERARCDWVLVLAADERVTPALRASIEAVLRGPAPEHTGYYAARRNYFLGRWMRYSGWYPQHELRLFRLVLIWALPFLPAARFARMFLVQGGTGMGCTGSCWR